MKGKANNKFFEWLFITHKIVRTSFNLLPLVCQQSLLVEWFDSVGIYITPTHNYIKETFGWVIKMNSGDYVGKGFSTRPEALSKAIEKATEIFNNL